MAHYCVGMTFHCTRASWDIAFPIEKIALHPIAVLYISFLQGLLEKQVDA